MEAKVYAGYFISCGVGTHIQVSIGEREALISSSGNQVVVQQPRNNLTELFQDTVELNEALYQQVSAAISGERSVDLAALMFKVLGHTALVEEGDTKLEHVNARVKAVAFEKAFQ